MNKIGIYEDVNLALSHIGFSKNKKLLIDTVECVQKYELYGGVRVSSLAKELKVDPSTVTRNCKTLEKLGLITKENKQAKYHITLKGYKYNIIKAMTYETKSKIWEANIPIAMIKKDGKRILQNKFWEFNKISKFRYNDGRIEFLNFANKIGATIICLFLEVIKPDNRIEVIGKERDQQIINWISNMINPKAIFSEFCKLSVVEKGQPLRGTPSYNEQARDAEIKRVVENIELSKEEKQKKIKQIHQTFKSYTEYFSQRRRGIPESSRFELDITSTDKLFEIYKEVFPLVFKGISKHAKELHEEYIEALARRNSNS